MSLIQGISSPCFSARGRGQVLPKVRQGDPLQGVPGDLSCSLDGLVRRVVERCLFPGAIRSFAF